MVYKADVTNGGTKEYIGMAANSFKKRYGNRKKLFNNFTYSSETEFSKYVWNLKRSGRDHSIKWQGLKSSALSMQWDTINLKSGIHHEYLYPTFGL
jgi:hypothetical protein